MARSKISKRGPRTVATLGLENQVAESKRNLRSIQQIIQQAKRDSVERTGGELMGKMPPMFVSVPTSVIGGAESYFQEIASATPRAFNNIFGKNKGARQIQVEAFKTFEMARDSETQEQLDYITIAASVESVLAYNICQIVSDISNADTSALIKVSVSTFQTQFALGKTIIESLEAVRNVATLSGHSWTAELGSIPTRGALVYPLNEKFLAARDKAIAKVGISAENKAKFLQTATALSAYRKYSISHAPSESVALPKQISDATDATALVKWFKESHQYSLEDTFRYYRDAVNSIDATKSTRNSAQIQKGLKLLNRAFDEFIVDLRNSMHDDVESEAQALKREFFDILSEKATADDFLLAELALMQATSTSALRLSSSSSVDASTIESLGFNHFSSLDLIDLLNESNDVNVSAADLDLWRSWHKIYDLLAELRNQALSISDQRKIETALSDALAEVSTLYTGSTGFSNVSSDFEKFANDSLKTVAEGIAKSFNTDFDTELSSRGALYDKAAVGNRLVSVLNAMFKLYTDADVFQVIGVPTLVKFNIKYTNVQFNEVAIASLAEGDGLDFVVEGSDDFVSKEAEIALEQLRFECQSARVPNALYGEIETFIIDGANEFQTVFDALLLEAERDPDMAIFKNEGTLGMWSQIGIGAGAFVGTHAVTALAQRFANPEGITEGWKYQTAEYLPAALVGAVGGGYYWYKEDRKDIAIPMIGGAIGSVLLRVLTRKFVHSDNIISKTLLKYVGAKPAELLGDKTFLPRIDLTEAAKVMVDTAKQTSEVASQVLPQLQQTAVDFQNIPSTSPATPSVNGYIDDQGYSMPAEPQMYAAPAGLGRYMSAPMYDPFWSYNPPTELTYSQAQNALNHGAQLAGMGDVDLEEVEEILASAQPLSQQEIVSEGLSGYVNEMIIRATPKSAQKLQDASAATMVGQSSLVPNSYLMKIGTTGEEGGIIPEYNPSLPSGVFAPQEIDPVNHPDVVTSGLFSRGAFASRLPTAEDGFDY
jgi:hypothetical protein